MLYLIKRRSKDVVGNNSLWLSHGRPISIDQLRALKLKIEDYAEETEKAQKPTLRDLIDGYYRLVSECIFKYKMMLFIHTRETQVII